MRCTLVVLFAVIVVCAAFSQPFTYQGSLRHAGLPASGDYSMTFRLFGSLAGADQIGGNIVQNVSVAAGLFTAVLDFGTTAFNGSDRWLEVQVGGQVLSPRIKLNAVPYAAYAHKPWVKSGTAVHYSDGNVGIGTSTPGFPLTFANQLGAKISLYGQSGNSYGFGIQSALLQIHTNVQAADIAFGYGSSEAFTETMRVKGNGRVGIGTSAPVYKFDVLGAGGVARFSDGSRHLAAWLGDSEGADGAFFGTTTAHSLILLSSNTARVTVLPNGDVGIGTTTPMAKLDLRGPAIIQERIDVVDETLSTKVFLGAPGGVGRIHTYNANGVHMNYISTNGATNFPLMGVLNSAQTAVAGGILRDNVSGTVVFANVKNFVEPNRNDPTTDIWYASLEGPEAAMYARGSGRLANGEAQIVLPDHFLSMIVPGSLTVHLTPGSRSSKGLGYEYGPNGITVFELAGGKGAYEFSWTVTSVRKGFENYRVLRPWDEIAPVETDREKAWQARLKELEEKK